MNRDFIIASLKALLPIILVFSFLYVSGHLSSDYFYHVRNVGDGNYAPALSWILSFAGESRGLALFAINLISTTFLPFILVHRITGKVEAGWVYLYSGIPLVLFSVWLVPQSLIQVLMLAAIVHPFWLVIFMLTGYFIHTYWLGGIALTLGYLWLRHYQTGKLYA